ncbi:MAG: flagellar hook protein, partial [Synergistaceae bacterium]|nr:flagellar hook protein [Synergistaceae bacterium]
MSDSLFQVTGVSSGIAWDEIITKLLESAKKPATQWQTKIDTLEVKKTLYQDLQSEFNKLRTTLTRLKLASSYKKKTPEYAVYDPPGAAGSSVVTATITDDADYSSWDIVVNKVANAQRNVSTRFDSVSEALGIAGRFRIQIGMQYTTIAIDPENTLRDINYKLYNAVDQEGDPMAITAKILDNRLVIESAAEGQYNGGVEEYKLFDMTSSDVMYIPHAATRDASGQYLFPPQLLEVSYTTTNVDGTDYTYQYKDGVDFDYDSKTG